LLWLTILDMSTLFDLAASSQVRHALASPDVVSCDAV
jgi:hypothetical protein